ncbi:MAG: hypothetical protein HYR85_16580, partial [Planctomycetes bacterium]|nr:hypothetical protein [Planctomycetota bacterium]
MCFKTDRPKEINGRLDDWDVRQWDPTRLIELRDKRLAVVNRGPWGGEKDLSATIYTAWDDYNLYLAGSVRDDQLVRVPDRDWWTQDAIELFFATGGAEERRRPDDAPYSDRDYQIFLMPMNPRLPWGVFKHGSSIVLGPGEFEGVRVAFTTTSEGYDFEMVLPFVNFVGLEPKSGLSIGFDVALDDVDDATKTDTKSYMTWSGHTDLARLPSRFGRLEFRDLLPPTPSPSSGIWEGERLILWAVTLIAGLAIFTFVLNAFAVRWYSKTLTWKLTVASILVVALALTTLVPTLVASNQEETERVRLTERVDRTRRVLDEVASKQLLDLSESTGQDQLLRLLRGERVPHREAFAYECLRLADVGTQKTAEVTPYLDYGDGFDFRAGSFVFPAPKAVRADRVHFIFSVPGTSAASDPSRASDSTVGRFTIVFENGERRPVELKLGYTADYSVQGIPYDHAKSMAPNLRIASRIGLPGSLLQQHTDELIVDVPTNLRSVAIDSIELAVESPQETVRLLGITREVGAALMTFPIAHRSLVGVPVEMVRQGFDGFAAQIENDKPFVKPEVNAHADVLWIVYATLKAHPTPSASPTGAPVAEVHVRYEGGSEQTTMLLSGVDVDDAEKGWPQGHPGIMNSRVAFRFPLTPNGENVAHVDILRLPVDGKHEIQSISIEKKRSEQLRLYAMTLGTLVQPAYPDLKEVVIDAQGLLVLANESRADLASLRFSVHPRPSSASPGETEATPPIRRERLTNGDFLMASLVAPEPTGLGRIDVASPFEPSPIPLLIRTWGSYLLLGFLVPLAVVILLDLFDLGPRLRWKFAAAFAIVCIVPLGMLFPLFNNLIRANVEARLSDKAVSRLKTVLDGIRDRRDRVQLATDAMWRDNQLQDLLRIADGADVRVDAIRARLTELRNDRFPEHKNAFVLVNVNRAKPDGGFATTPVSSELGGDAVASSSMLGVANAVDENDVYSASGDLVVFGARLERPRGRGHDLLVGEPLDAAFLALLAKEEKGGRGAEILVYTTKGYPYLATLDDSEEKSPRAIAATRETLRTLEERGGTHELNRRIRNEDYHVGYCLLQNQKGATLGLIGVAVPAEEAAGFLDRVTKYFLLLGALIAGLSIFVGTLLTRKITGPIERLGLLTKE